MEGLLAKEKSEAFQMSKRENEDDLKTKHTAKDSKRGTYLLTCHSFFYHNTRLMTALLNEAKSKRL